MINLYKYTIHEIFCKKTLYCIELSFPIAAIFKFIQLYIYNDWSFLISLGILIILDTVLGVVNAIKEHNFSAEGFGKFSVKILVYSCLLIATHVITEYTIDGEHQTTLSFIHSVVMGFMIAREAFGTFQNATYIYPGIVPSYILKFLSSFSESGQKLEK